MMSKFLPRQEHHQALGLLTEPKFEEFGLVVIKSIKPIGTIEKCIRLSVSSVRYKKG